MLAAGIGLVCLAWKTSWKLAATRSPSAPALRPGSALAQRKTPTPRKPYDKAKVSLAYEDTCHAHNGFRHMLYIQFLCAV